MREVNDHTGDEAAGAMLALTHLGGTEASLAICALVGTLFALHPSVGRAAGPQSPLTAMLEKGLAAHGFLTTTVHDGPSVLGMARHEILQPTDLALAANRT